ncbi:hypothetical protein DH2020_031460 [Rehmannia glutinosa]|uniref:Sugar phosphate transporter domain-containing protein n=1 Tax=Rehmannia glutinosa TaxID=99300 RepID=A0ABR0VK82_REHGL
MAFSANQSYATASTFSENLPKKTIFSPMPHNFPTLYPSRKIALSHKPLHISAATGFGYIADPDDSSRAREPSIQCNAYEARRSPSIPISIEIDQEAAAQKLKIGVYFATWWALNVVFNIYNKKVLNAFPFPWLTSTLSLAAGSVALAHTIGHVAATVSMSKVAVSFTHIIKSGEPAFSVLVSRFLMGETFPMPVYLSLLPIIGGCALSAATELNFNLTAVEGPQLWAVGWQNAVSQIGPNFIWWVVAQSVFYHLYNQVSYMSLNEISPLTFSIGNTMKRISVIVASIIIFQTPLQPINALGAAIAISGTFLYSQAKQ